MIVTGLVRRVARNRGRVLTVRRAVMHLSVVSVHDGAVLADRVRDEHHVPDPRELGHEQAERDGGGEEHRARADKRPSASFARGASPRRP